SSSISSSILHSESTTTENFIQRTGSSRRRWRLHPGMATLNSVAILLLTAISLFTSTASAALITTFSNCLPQYVIDSPTHLQFHPIAVDARLDLEKLPYLLNL